jgi:hypothetical protein
MISVLNIGDKRFSEVYNMSYVVEDIRENPDGLFSISLLWEDGEQNGWVNDDLTTTDKLVESAE